MMSGTALIPDEVEHTNKQNGGIHFVTMDTPTAEKDSHLNSKVPIN